MSRESVVGTLSALSAPTNGVFRGSAAVGRGITRKRLHHLVAAGVIERLLPDTYRMTAVVPSNRQALTAALLWAGPRAAAAGRSAGELYGLDGVRAPRPEIVVPRRQSPRSPNVVVHRTDDALMVRRPGIAARRDLLEQLDPSYAARSVLEVKTRRLLVARHDDADDYEFDNDKWTVPGRHGYRIVLATWDKVTRQAVRLASELGATLAA